MKRAKILLALSIVVIMLFVSGCTNERSEGSDGSYTWVREGSTLEEGGLRFSVDELSHLVIDTIHNNVRIETHSGNDIIIAYVPASPGGGSFFHHTIRPRYEFTDGRLEIFRDVRLAPNTFVLGGSINILVPIYDGLLFDGISITTTNGQVEMGNFNTNTATVNTTNGQIVVANISVEDRLALQTTNGRIAITDSHVVGYSSATTTNGTVDVTNLSVEGSLALQTTNGRIEITGSHTEGYLSATTTNGNMSVTNISVEDNLTLQTTNGHIAIADSYVGDTLSATTTNGNITVTNVDTDIDNADLNTSRHHDVIINE